MPTARKTAVRPAAPAADSRFQNVDPDLEDGRLHPPSGLGRTTVVATGHVHEEPTDCDACAPVLQAEGWRTPRQFADEQHQAFEAELRRRERARVLGLDLPL